jgi:uncharacterized protein YndB with AHSA1/START domain
LTVGRLGRKVVRLGLLIGIGAWLADRQLHERAGGRVRQPIRTSITIDAPIEKVWAVLADIERQPAWMHDLKSVRLTTPGPGGVGTRGVGRVQVFGFAVDDPVEVTVFDAPSHFAIRHDGLVGGSGDMGLSTEPDGSTTVTWDETLVPPVLPDLGALVLALVFRPIFQRDLERLAGLVEAG